MLKPAYALMGMSYKMIVDTKIFAARNMAEEYSGFLFDTVKTACIAKKLWMELRYEIIWSQKSNNRLE